ncbi:MAG: glycosyltransferase family 39 protein [Verrucomicrobia bacterium]|nr:glycosyltransferase family 39 protein [Verrucomicrobiota bacterium]
MSMQTPPPDEGRATLWSVTLIVLVWAALFGIRLAGPPDLLDKDQQRPAMYVLDAVRNGHWICQRDDWGEITSKPPMHTWLAALATLPFERINRFSLYLPGALATLALALIIFAVGRKQFGGWAGLSGALAYLVSMPGARQVALARTDGLFALTIALAALAAWRAWRLGRGWTWFWLAAAAVTLTKGPLGVVLAAGGLLAALWERRSGERAPLRGSQVAGIALFALLAGGWFALAWWQMGQELIDKMIGSELVEQAVGRKYGIVGAGFAKPAIYFLVRFAPWSLLACLGFWRVWARPSADAGQRRFERFLFCWFFTGLVIFSLATHQRFDHLLPLIPVAALFAGRELSRLAGTARPRAVLTGVVATITVGLAAIGHSFGPALATTERAIRTKALERAAELIRSRAGEGFPLTYVDTESTFQFYMNTMRTRVPAERAAELLRGETPAFVAVRRLEGFGTVLGTHAPPLHVLLRWPATGECFIAIVSNHPRLERTGRIASAVGRP